MLSSYIFVIRFLKDNFKKIIWKLHFFFPKNNKEMRRIFFFLQCKSTSVSITITKRTILLKYDKPKSKIVFWSFLITLFLVIFITELFLKNKTPKK